MPAATVANASEITVLHDRPDHLIVKLTHFSVGSHRLRADHLKYLKDEVGPRLRSGGSVTLVGLASRTGSAATNQALSERRTGEVLRQLRTEAGSAFKVNSANGSGEEAARLAGQRDGVEDASWRAVLLIWWRNPDPPPVAPPPTPPPTVGRYGGKTVHLPEQSASSNEPGHGYNTLAHALRAAWNPDRFVVNDGPQVQVPETHVVTEIRYKLQQKNGAQWYDVTFTWGPLMGTMDQVSVDVYSGYSVEQKVTPRRAMEIYEHPAHRIFRLSSSR